MRAAQINSYGDKSVMHTISDAPKPTCGADEVLVEVHAAGVNAADWKIRRGDVRAMGELTFPATLGGDVAGIVAEIGEEVPGFSVGEKVYSQANFLGGQGAFAEFTPVKAASLAPMPASTDFIHAAALPTTAVSAYQVIVGHINLQRGQKILIHGGAGGIGSFAIQIAKHLGAFVATTATGDGIAFVKNLGADQVIDYKKEAFETILSDFDAVHDTVGGDTYVKSFNVLKPGGIIVGMLGNPQSEQLAAQYNVRAVTQRTDVSTETLANITELVDAGAITAAVGKVFPLEEAGDAVAYVEEGRQQGKVIIAVRD